MSKKKVSALDALGGGDLVRAMIKEIVATEVKPLAEELTAAREIVAIARQFLDDHWAAKEDELIEELGIACAAYDLVTSTSDKVKERC